MQFLSLLLEGPFCPDNLSKRPTPSSVPPPNLEAPEVESDVEVEPEVDIDLTKIGESEHDLRLASSRRGVDCLFFSLL
jgi:hypothetical protein